MDAGRLDRTITIRRVSVADVTGLIEPVETWSDIATVRAYAVPVSDAERARAGETLAQVRIRFTVRYSSQVSSIDPRDRLAFEGRTFDINGVKEVGRRQYLEITATARAETP